MVYDIFSYCENQFRITPGMYWLVRVEDLELFMQMSTTNSDQFAASFGAIQKNALFNFLESAVCEFQIFSVILWVVRVVVKSYTCNGSRTAAFQTKSCKT